MPTSSLARWYPLLIFVVFAIIGALVMWPVPAHPSTLLFAQSGDPFGTVYGLFQAKTAWPGFTFPWEPFLVVTSTLASRMLGEIAAYNLIIYSGFVLTGFAGYLLGKQLTKSHAVGFLLGLLLTLSPFHVSRSLQHLGLANLEWLVFFYWALLVFDEAPSLGKAIGVGILFVITTLDSYLYGLFGVGLLVIFGMWKFIGWFVSRHRSPFSWRVTKMVVLGAVVALVAIIPAVRPLLIPADAGAVATAAPSRSPAELVAYSAQWFAYALPSPDNPLFGGLTRPTYAASLSASGSNLTELSLYPGWITILLAIAGLVVSTRSANNPRERWLAGLLVATTLFMLWSSFAPAVTIGPWSIPTLSQWLYPHLPFNRVYSRFAFPVLLAVAGLAAIGARWLLQRTNPQKRTWLFVAICLAVTCDLLALPRNHTVAIGPQDLPAEYRLLPTNGSVYVAEYPLFSGDEPQSYQYLLWDRLTHARLLYTEVRDASATPTRLQFTDPSQSAVITKLIQRGVGYILVHRNLYTEAGFRKHPLEVGKVPPTITDPRAVFIQRIDDTDIYQLIPATANAAGSALK